MSLNQLFDFQLPLNRKELYYTGTVFPMIVCQDNFEHFDRFTSLLDGYPLQSLRVSPSDTNIQFFTEYNFAASVIADATERFPDAPTFGDTPDILIHIVGQPKVLIALEAKVFHAPSGHNLNNQMSRQRFILEYLQDTLQIDHLFQYALIPEKLYAKIGDFGFPVLTWESIYTAFEPVDPDNYFLAILKYALDNYDALVSARISGANNEGFMSGLSIREAYYDGTLEMNIMGRFGGLDGNDLATDISTGRWKIQSYETSSAPTPPNRNWFEIEDFITHLERHKNNENF